MNSSDVLRDILDMDPDLMSKDPDFVEWVSGNMVLDGSFPMAHRYGGHQFGSWVSIFYSSQVEEKGPRSEKTRSKLFNCETNFLGNSRPTNLIAMFLTNSNKLEL